MARWVALLRGVNVGGHAKVPMEALRRHLTDAGYLQVRTLIQSGNVVLDAAEGAAEADVADGVAATVAVAFGLEVAVAVRSAAEFAAVAAAHPFTSVPGAADNLLHVAWCAGEPAPGALAGVDPDRASPDRLALGPRVLYAFTPAGLGRSKVFAGLERVTGPLTVRNLGTVSRLVAMCG